MCTFHVYRLLNVNYVFFTQKPLLYWPTLWWTYPLVLVGVRQSPSMRKVQYVETSLSLGPRIEVPPLTRDTSWGNGIPHQRGLPDLCSVSSRLELSWCLEGCVVSLSAVLDSFWPSVTTSGTSFFFFFFVLTSASNDDGKGSQDLRGRLCQSLSSLYF